jgi:glycosyltransferase involved in cell wall biosynthesis
MHEVQIANDLPLSVVIPLYNEEAIVEPNLDALATFFDRMVGVGNWLFILIENGSTDATPDRLKVAAKRWPLSKVIHLDRPNVGTAFKTGLMAATTKWVYVLEIEQWDLPFIAWAWKNRNSYELFLGSKRADPTLNHQEPYRRLLSCALNSVLQVLFSFTGTDTHGPKLLDRVSLDEIITKCELDRGQFDSELVLRAARSGKRVVEVPFPYRDVRPHRNLMLKKIVWNCLALHRLVKVMSQVPYEGYVRHYRFSREEVLRDRGELSLEGADHDDV